MPNGHSPFPEFDKTIAELDQPWFFGPHAGANYRGILTTQFNAAVNRAQIDKALSPGVYVVHSDANKQQRAALRAVLLANFLMNSHPVGLVDQLRKKYDRLDVANLKRVFANTFPALQDNGNRPAWNPANLTDPATLNGLKKPRFGNGPHLPLPQFRFIIHGVGNYMGDVFDTPTILTRYEVLSMSLMANTNLHAHDPQGVILRVPENNILAASPTDVAVQNYAPAFNPNDPGAVTITDNLIDVAARTGGLRTPDYLLQNIRGYPYYNEVVVCGRGSVPLPHGSTGVMMVVGLFVLTDVNGEMRGDPATRQARDLRVKACARNHHLPVLYIPNAMASAGL
jgi:hypothetical protein